MSDSPREPGWAPPGDASNGASTDHPHHEDTASFSTEQTQRIPREDSPPPPPPPPPPSATGGWAPPEPRGGDRTYGPGGWAPPPRPRRRRGVVIGVLTGVVALVLLLGAGAVLLLRTVDTDVQVGGGDVGRGEATEIAPDRDAQDVPADDLEAQAEAVLRTINTSEERMIAFQRVVVDGVDENGTVGDAAAEIAQEAQDAGNDLTSLRSDLRSLAGGEGDGFDGLRDIRDTYASHMDAWIDYLDAVAGSPALAAPDSSDAVSFWRDIESTGDDFVAAVESGLPDGLSSDLEEFARFIVERGFGGSGDGPEGDIV